MFERLKAIYFIIIWIIWFRWVQKQAEYNPKLKEVLKQYELYDKEI